MNFESTITAITLSAKPAERQLSGVAFLNPVQTITNCSEYNAAFYAAISKVKTPYFFFLDDDDTLPDDYLSVLEDCLDENAAIAYTDEFWADSGIRVKPGAYSADAHARRPNMLHHLVLCHTLTAKSMLCDMPKGQFWPEMPLYFQMAKLGGRNMKSNAAYIPRIGYHWNRSETGLSSMADISVGQMRSKLWCLRGGR